MRRLALLCPLVLVALAGCGGGGADNGAQTGGGQDFTTGPFQTRAVAGKPQTLTSTLNGPTITGIAGASFIHITYLPTAGTANSRLLFDRYNGLRTLYIANNDGTNPRLVPNVFVGSNASWSRDGRIVFDDYDPVANRYQIYVVNSDGTNRHKISPAGGTGDTHPVWAPDNFHIAFQRADASTHQQIYTMTSGGASLLDLSDGTTDDTNPSWSPDATQVLFTRFNSVGGQFNVWRVNANGTSPLQISSGTSVPYYALSPSGAYIAVSEISGSDYAIHLYTYPSYSFKGNLLSTASQQFLIQGWANDGSRMVYRRILTSTQQLYSATPDGYNQVPLEDFTDNSMDFASWEPQPIAIPYVSSTGGYTVYNASSGFIYGLNGNAFASFLNFTATTPTSTTLTVDPITNGSTNVIYHIHGDALTSIRYVNGFGGGVNVASLGAGAQQALVSFNAADGTISSVLAVASKKSPTLQHSGTSILCSGQITGVWNAKGINLAPHGAAQVVLGKNGEVISAK